jgi:hypothetical protein
MCHGCTALSREVAALVSERDAANAEVAALQRLVAALEKALDAEAQAEAAALRERLDGLRARVNHTIPHDRRCNLLDPACGGRGKVMCSCGLTDAVLALFDEFECN